MKKFILSLAVFLMFFHLTAFCQNGDPISNAISNLKTLLTDHISEKAYLHFDRPYGCYVAGETVYFKAYVFMGERREPSTLSNVLHVDLIDKNDVLLRSISLQLTGGTGWGDFALPDSLSKGLYRIRAYTQWMRNAITPNYFDQFLSVSTVNGVDRAAGKTAPGLKPDLQFFPEGGSLVAEVPSKMAFKAVGANGLGINVKGVVVDNAHKEVAKIISAHLGMGEFSFIPELGKTYQAMVNFADGAQYTLPLPEVQQKGITLAVNTDDPSKVSITIRANRPYYKENMNKKYELLIYYSGALKHYSPVLDNPILGLDLPASGFPTGIVKITLMSETGEPLNERLVFVQNPDLLNLSISGNKPVYATRENAALSLSAKNKDGNPVNGSFSVSVVDESKILVDENEENSILSYMLLTTELKGHIEKPNFYFTNVNSETRADLDMLMLTQGFRRFDWKELESNGPAQASVAFAAEKNVDISGNLKTKSGEPVPNCVVTLIPQGTDGGATQVQTTDNAGKFRFPNMFVSTGMKFILKAQTPATKKPVLTIDKAAAGPAITPANGPGTQYNATADILAFLQNNAGQGLLTASNNTAIMAINPEKVSAAPLKYSYRSSNIGGSGHADFVVHGEQFKNIPTLSSGLQGILPGVVFNGGVPYLTTNMTVSKGVQQANPMLIMIDGTNMRAGYNIDILDPAEVETVELLKDANAAIYGIEGGQGVLVITTRLTYVDEHTISKEMSPGIFSIEPAGFYKAREFYAPKYDGQSNGVKVADNRTTIFWKPDLITDSDGNASFNFANADGKGTYRVEIQGTDSNGNIGMQVLRYKVQ
jgi:TonB-dependent SusC/RagA subfamily outer membrane receptor